jgi:hypothetical protein
MSYILVPLCFAALGIIFWIAINKIYRRAENSEPIAAEIKPTATATPSPKPNAIPHYTRSRLPVIVPTPSPSPVNTPVPSSTPEDDIQEVLTSGRLSRGWTMHKRGSLYSVTYILNTDGMNPAIRNAVLQNDSALDADMSAKAERLWAEIRKQRIVPRPPESPIGEIKYEESIEHVVHWFNDKDALVWNCEIMDKGSAIGQCPEKRLSVHILNASNRATIDEMDKLAVRSVNKRYVDALIKVSK